MERTWAGLGRAGPFLSNVHLPLAWRLHQNHTERGCDWWVYAVSQSGKDLIQEIRKILDLKYWSASMRSRCCLVIWEHHLALFSDWKHFQCYTFWSLSDWKLTEEPKIGYQMQLQTSGRLFWGWDVSQAVTIPQEPNESVISNHLRVQLHHLPSVQLYPQK